MFLAGEAKGTARCLRKGGPEHFCLKLKPKGPDKMKIWGQGGPRARCLQKGALDRLSKSNRRSQNILEIFPAGGAQGAQGQMPSKRCLGAFFFKLQAKGPKYFKDVSGRGGPRGAQGQMPSKRCPETFLQLESKGPEHFRNVSGRAAQGGQGPDAFKKLP